MKKRICFFILALTGCVADKNVFDDFIYSPVATKYFEIATWQKLTNSCSPVHMYIEGDGNAFDVYGYPTTDPTPKGRFVRELATSDNAENVVYMARPCQFICSENCNQRDWTGGRFSEKVIDSMAEAIRKVAKGREIILIGYSGGALLSGLIIQNNEDLMVKKWVTIAGVLNHSAWTEYFNDSPLSDSIDLDELPNVPQLHYVAEYDMVVPLELTYRFANMDDIIVVQGATHGNFGDLKLDLYTN